MSEIRNETYSVIGLLIYGLQNVTSEDALIWLAQVRNSPHF